MTELYTPTQDVVRNLYAVGRDTTRGTTEHYSVSVFFDEFDRWFLQEIEQAEYSGYLRAVREGLHR